MTLDKLIEKREQLAAQLKQIIEQANQQIAAHQGAIGLLDELIAKNKAAFLERYKLNESDLEDRGTLFENIGRKRGCLISGGSVDIEKARRILLMDYRNMKLGYITFDDPLEEKYYGEARV